MQQQNRYAPFRFACILMLLGILQSAILQGQTATGGIIGTISDSTGSVIVGATVLLKSAKSGLTQRTVTNSNGDYTLLSLEPGGYQLSVDANGFQSIRTDVRIQVGGTANGSFGLSLRSSSTQVTVLASSADVNVNTVQLMSLKEPSGRTAVALKSGADFWTRVM